MTKPRKKYWRMTSEELAEAIKEFDPDGVADSFGPMTAEAEAAWRRARQKGARGRSTKRAHIKRISVAIDAPLLKRADALAKKRGISRAELRAEG